jgi:hypothetical protein
MDLAQNILHEIGVCQFCKDVAVMLPEVIHVVRMAGNIC